jgi:hypothetical protein
LTPTEAVLPLYKPEPKAKACPELSRRGKKQRAKGKREEQHRVGMAHQEESEPKLETSNSKLETVVHMKLLGANPQPQKNPLAPVSGERARVRGSDPEPTEQIVLRMKLLGANPNPQVAGLDELPGKSHYFIGNDPSRWHTGIPHYARVKYEELYPGIDLVYYGNQRQLEYDFVIAPGADPKAIRIAFDGLVGAGPRACPQEGDHRGSPLRIDAQGDLLLHAAGGEFRLHKPRIYQEINGIKQPISGGYVLLSPQPSSLITFQVAAYDTSKPLIIDPTLSYSTYLGGSTQDFGYGIAVDSSGNVYVPLCFVTE